MTAPTYPQTLIEHPQHNEYLLMDELMIVCGHVKMIISIKITTKPPTLTVLMTVRGQMQPTVEMESSKVPIVMEITNNVMMEHQILIQHPMHVEPIVRILSVEMASEILANNVMMETQIPMIDV